MGRYGGSHWLKTLWDMDINLCDVSDEFEGMCDQLIAEHYGYID